MALALEVKQLIDRPNFAHLATASHSRSAAPKGESRSSSK